MIRPARETDVTTIHQLIKGLAEYERLADEAVATEDDIRTALFGARPFAEVLLAEERGEPVAFALFFHNFSTFVGRPGLYLEDLFVLPAWRGRGIGRDLLEHLKAIAVERGCGRVEWSVLDWNRTAIGFYERIGAEVLADWRICRLTLPASPRRSSQG